MYMFRPIAAIIRFPFESMVVAQSYKRYYHTFEWKPDDGRNRPKHVDVVISILY